MATVGAPVAPYTTPAGVSLSEYNNSNPVDESLAGGHGSLVFQLAPKPSAINPDVKPRGCPILS